MTRRIHCLKCTWPELHPEDVATGWSQRIVRLAVRKPASHAVTTTHIGGEKDGQREVEELASIICDGCGKAIPDGEEAIAITMWRKEREPEPEAWESEYGQPK